MIWKKDKLKPTQPFFVLDTENFYQEIYLKQGISHFYTFRILKKTILKAVPDGCIDLVFEYTDTGMKSFACGSVLKCTGEKWDGPKEVFGVRFMPGYHPAGLEVSLRDLLENRIPLENHLKETEMIKQLSEQSDFYQRIRVFLQEYTKLEKKEEKPYGKKELVLSVKALVYQSDGLIRISDVEAKTGYTARYINKVFIEEMGFSPKTFCKIIQFQRALEFLNYGAPDKMTDAAVYLGYYDQPQFIRDFKEYAGITPAKYLKLVEDKIYRDRVQNANFQVD